MIHPLQNYLYIEPHKEESSFNHADEGRLERATVKILGPDVKTLKVEDVIYYKSYNPDVIEIDGVEHVFIKEDQVICTVTTT